MKSLVVFAIPCQKCDCECWDFGADSTVPNTTCISVREAFAIHTKPFSMSLLGAADPETSALNVLQILIFGVWFRVMRLRSGCSACLHNGMNQALSQVQELFVHRQVSSF